MKKGVAIVLVIVALLLCCCVSCCVGFYALGSSSNSQYRRDFCDSWEDQNPDTEDPFNWCN